MKALELPFTYEDMRYSLSLTGITELKQSRYKKRHGGLTDIEQAPGRVFRKITPAKPMKNTKRRKKKSAKIQNTNTTNLSKPEKKTRLYRINKKEVIHKIRGYLNQMKGEKMLYFWTVTFPMGTTDDAAFILLNKWLTRLRKEKMIKEYLWITERQENNTLHYHIVINRKMDVKKANKYMRASIMYSIGTGEVKWTREQAIKYNGVDICKNRKTKRVTNFGKGKKQKSLALYLTKYITKNNGDFSHLAWHSSREYSNIITSIRITEREYSVSKCGELISKEVKMENEWYIFRAWKKETPKDLLQYLHEINNYVQQI